MFFLPGANHNPSSGIVEIAVVFAGPLGEQSRWRPDGTRICPRSSSVIFLPECSTRSIDCNTSRHNIRKLGVKPVWCLTVDLIAIPTVARCRSQSTCCLRIKHRSIWKMVRFIRSTWPFNLGRDVVVTVLTIFNMSHSSLNIQFLKWPWSLCNSRGHPSLLMTPSF